MASAILQQKPMKPMTISEICKAHAAGLLTWPETRALLLAYPYKPRPADDTYNPWQKDPTTGWVPDTWDEVQMNFATKVLSGWNMYDLLRGVEDPENGPPPVATSDD